MEVPFKYIFAIYFKLSYVHRVVERNSGSWDKSSKVFFCKCLIFFRKKRTFTKTDFYKNILHISVGFPKKQHFSKVFDTKIFSKSVKDPQIIRAL